MLGTAALDAYMRGDYPRTDRLARAGLELATDAEGRRYCLTPLAVADLSRGAWAGVIEHSLAAATLATHPTQNFGVAALAATYAGDLERARPLNDRMMAAAASPTTHAVGAYAAGKIDNAAGRLQPAEEHLRAISLARSSGATFVVGV